MNSDERGASCGAPAHIPLPHDVEQALELLVDAEYLVDRGWTRTCYAEDALGREVRPPDDSAEFFSASGSLWRAAFRAGATGLRFEHDLLNNALPELGTAFEALANAYLDVLAENPDLDASELEDAQWTLREADLGDLGAYVRAVNLCDSIQGIVITDVLEALRLAAERLEPAIDDRPGQS